MELERTNQSVQKVSIRVAASVYGTLHTSYIFCYAVSIRVAASVYGTLLLTLQNYIESSKPNDLWPQVSICQRTGYFHHVIESPWPDCPDFNNRSFRVDTSSRVRAARSCRLIHRPSGSLASDCFLPHCGTDQTAMSSFLPPEYKHSLGQTQVI